MKLTQDTDSWFFVTESVLERRANITSLVTHSASTAVPDSLEPTSHDPFGLILAAAVAVIGARYVSSVIGIT